MNLQPRVKQQTGYVLLLMLLALMGIGGAVVAGFTQDVKKQAEHERYLHNERILKEAKQALLQFAYNYPQFNGEGPGRLPCPDTNNNGEPGDGTGIDLVICTSVGHFPWSEAGMNFYDARDASGERLWYAVSDAFYNLGGGPVINSDSLGTITVQDQSGEVSYDGTIAGIAAIIIAPGPPIDRAGVAQNRIPANVNNPIHYLDLSGGSDNADFVNLDPNGFVLGPIDDLATGTILVNDQMIIITAEDVIAMAEKATLQAYRKALRDYDERVDTFAAGDHFPWLYNYAVTNLFDYPSDIVFATEKGNFLGNKGRVPSIYTDYFTETTGQPIESHLGVDLTLEYPLATVVGFVPALPTVFTTPSDQFTVANDHVIVETSTDPLTVVTFEDTDPDVFSANDGRLTATAGTPETFSDFRFFWDEFPIGNGWTECLGVGAAPDDETDCNRTAGVNIPQGVNDTPSQVLRVQVDVNLAGVVNFDAYYNPVDLPVVAIESEADDSVLLDSTGHATISGTFAGANLDSSTLPITVSYIFDYFYDLNFDNEASGTIALADLMQNGSLGLTLRYYPELPSWVFSNRWYESVLTAYAPDYLPDAIGGPPCTPAVDCLTVNNTAGITNDKAWLFAIASQHNWFPDDFAPGLQDDVLDVFDIENDIANDVFDARAIGGNDKIMAMEQF